jgi:hypothetical protein
LRVNDLIRTTTDLLAHHYTAGFFTLEKYYTFGTQEICIKYNPGVPFNSGASL